MKFWINSTFGHHKFLRSWNKDFRSKFESRTGRDLQSEHPIREIQSLILAKHPILKAWPDQTVTCFDLMYLESEAILGAMLELKRLHSAPSLCVHDSIIVKRSDRRVAEAALKNNFLKTCGFVPVVSA